MKWNKVYHITIIYLCMFCWFVPQAVMMTLNAEYVSMLNALKCILWGVILLQQLLFRKKMYKLTLYLHGAWILFLCCIIWNVPEPSEINTWLTPFCSVCGFAILLDCYAVEDIIHKLFRYLFWICSINLILLFVRPEAFSFTLLASDGLSSYTTYTNFVSTDNNFAPVAIILLLTGELNRSFGRITRAEYTLTWMITIFSVLKIFSGTCIIGVGVFGGAIVWRKLRKRVKGVEGIQVKHLVICQLGLFVMIYYFHIQNIFSLLLVNILGKDLTLSGRIGLWETAIDMIRDNWIWGYGNKNYGAIILREYFYWYAHNLVLDILLQGGGITFAGFSLCLSAFSRRIRKVIGAEEIQLCMIALLAFVIINITESYFSSLYFYVPFLLCAALARRKGGTFIISRVRYGRLR